jgi:hypothetical protein
MATVSRTLPNDVGWRPAMLAAAVAVGGALSMTIVLAAVAMLASVLAGVPARQAPTLLTTDAAFPWFCAAAGVFSALLAGYITARRERGPWIRQVTRACLLTGAGHIAVVGTLGSPLAAWATSLYIALTMPALCLGCYLGSPAPNATTNVN